MILVEIKRKIKNFKSIRRGYYSLIIVIGLLFFSLVAELFINNRALIVKYEKEYYFPVLGFFYGGETFGLDYSYETNYKELKTQFQNQEHRENWVLLPWIPYNPYENDFQVLPPSPPSWKNRHLLGTDLQGRDVFARIVYGFRIAIFFSLALYALSTFIGTVFGCLMGYFGGIFDILFQRIVEIWSSLPVLYILIIMAALIVPSVSLLLIIFVFFNWTGMTWLMRAEIYREKGKQYCEAARAMGASHSRIIFLHLLPNSLVPLVTALPFQIVAGISTLSSLDYLGYGLPVPTPSWGELLQQGQNSFTYAWWILISPSIAAIFILSLFTFIGESLRECFNPREDYFIEG